MASVVWSSVVRESQAQSRPFFWPHAQPRKASNREYVPIPFTGNLEELLRARLDQAGQKDSLQELWNKLQEDVKKHHLHASQMPPLDWQDPRVQKLLQGLLDKPPPTWQLPPEQLHKLREVLKQMGSGKEIVPPQLPTPSPLPAASGGDQVAVPDDHDLGRWLREWMSEVEESNLGDWLRDSPAWRSALEDAQTWLANPEQRLGWWSPDSLPAWKVPQGWFQSRGDIIGPAWQNLSWPEMPEVDLPRLSLPRLGRRGGPGQAVLPRWDEGVLIHCLGWLAVLLAGGWLLWRLSKLRTRLPARNTLPGNWPIDLAGITSAAALIRAFEFLAMNQLGAQARAWNHRRIADQLGVAQASTQAAKELAGCYEKARYAPGGQEVTAAEIAAASRHLEFLARGDGS